MRLFLTGSSDPFYNLACEEYLLKQTEDDVFMLWQNRPTVVIGRNQNLYEEVDLPYTEANGIAVVRRITGGGAVYHDSGNVNFSFITSREKAAVLDFDYFTKPVRDALGQLGLDVLLSGRNDLLIQDADGILLKCSGNAQTATDRRILSHGTLLFDSDLEVMKEALKPDPEKLTKRSIQSVRSRVTNLRPLLSGSYAGMDTAAFFEFLAETIEKTYGILRETVERTPEIASYEARNRSEDYVAGRRTPHDFAFRKRFDAGLVVLLYRVEDGIVRDASIEGDFFGERDASELAAMLNGREACSLPETIRSLPVETYIRGVNGLMLAEILG